MQFMSHLPLPHFVDALIQSCVKSAFLQLAIHFTNHSYKNSFTIKDRHKTSLSDDFDMIVIMRLYR